MQLGGQLDFIDVDINKYNEFLDEVKAC